MEVAGGMAKLIARSAICCLKRHLAALAAGRVAYTALPRSRIVKKNAGSTRVVLLPGDGGARSQAACPCCC